MLKILSKQLKNSGTIVIWKSKNKLHTYAHNAFTNVQYIELIYARHVSGYSILGLGILTMTLVLAFLKILVTGLVVCMLYLRGYKQLQLRSDCSGKT